MGIGGCELGSGTLPDLVRFVARRATKRTIKRRSTMLPQAQAHLSWRLNLEIQEQYDHTNSQLPRPGGRLYAPELKRAAGISRRVHHPGGGDVLERWRVGGVLGAVLHAISGAARLEPRRCDYALGAVGGWVWAGARDLRQRATAGRRNSARPA